MKKYLLLIGALVSSFTFSSCNDDDDDVFKNAWFGTATVKPLNSSSYYLQIDDSTTLKPVDGYIPYFGLDKERRVRLSFNMTNDTVTGYDHAVRINYMDSILTKNIVKNLFEDNDPVYGNDPVEMRNIWIEDNYITMYFWTAFGGYKSHLINLVQMDPEKPYELEFRHNAFDDPQIATGRGLVCFRLHDLPNTNGQTVKLKIKYHSPNGHQQEVELDYNSRRPKSGTVPQLNSMEFQSIK